jgi:glucose/arabinose dehydrogenase
LRSNPDGKARKIVARGIRNSVGFDCHPQSKELWFTDNGPDSLGIDRPNDELNKVSKTGEKFGFPYCHDTGVADPKFGSLQPCSDFTAPVFGLQPHVAALGMKFDVGTSNANQITPEDIAKEIVRIAISG